MGTAWRDRIWNLRESYMTMTKSGRQIQRSSLCLDCQVSPIPHPQELEQSQSQRPVSKVGEVQCSPTGLLRWRHTSRVGVGVGGRVCVLLEQQRAGSRMCRARLARVVSASQDQCHERRVPRCLMAGRSSSQCSQGSRSPAVSLDIKS